MRSCPVRILFIGDIVGKPGRELVRRGLPALVERSSVDLVIANAENAAAGFGITREIGDQLLGWGVDVMTTGNHVWDKKEAIDYIGAEPRLLRPANYPAGVPGNGSYVARTADGRGAGVVNVMGRVFMVAIDDPFDGCPQGSRGAQGRALRRFRRLSRRGHVRKDGDGLASRRQGHCGCRHAHARADRRRADPAEGHGVPDRCRHDGPARFDHRRRDRGGARAFSERDAGAIRDRDRPTRGSTRSSSKRTRRPGSATDIERISYSLDGSTRLPGCRRTCNPLEPCARGSGRPALRFPVPPSTLRAIAGASYCAGAASPRRRSAAGLSVTELTTRVRDRLETEFFEVWVEGELSNCRAVEHGHLYFTLKDGGTDPRRHLSIRRMRYLKFKPPTASASSRGGGVGVRGQGRVSTRVRAPRAPRARGAAAGLRRS